MKQRAPGKLKRYEVIWRDSTALPETWSWLSELKRKEKRGIPRCKTVGYLLKSGKHMLWFCGNVSGYGAYGNVFIIPRGCIVSMRRLK